ncbi:putative chaperonin GroES 10 kDa protein [Babesia bovis T2Bo]|uniref:Chaperonin, 10 kDa domain containing protein n=1 Tax=Babesia bovis TaxID=5865 RepID=A7AWV1_BABBO|nr:putative chaperonin GroES 10 kDa protein [Babesia bovis T2Bo]EDO05529.1 putative chaperonin GroES 10 kDa protein [Babesia bovis T2Bo]|eukprot:XP_001609097.1 chaperonin, 10 kDa domain containing protein [Babesia bovis T2Bo]
MNKMSIAKKFVPLFDRVLVTKIKPDNKTKSGLLLPESSSLSSRLATVLAVGAGRITPKGDLVPPTLKQGDTVVIPEYGGMELKLDGERYSVFREEDIIGVINND